MAFSNMTLSLNIPDAFAATLGRPAITFTNAILEAFAVDGYRNGTLSAKQVRLLLGHESRWETESFLSAHDVGPSLTADEIWRDAEVAAAASLLCK